MKIAFIYGPFSVGTNAFDFSQIWTSPRGLTGSEMSCLQMATNMAGLGHEVTLYTLYTANSPPTWNGIALRPNYNLHETLPVGGFDAVCSWNEPDLLIHSPPGAVRLINQQLNDFYYCNVDFDKYVDIYTSPCEHHMEYIRPQTKSFHKWMILPNGCDPDSYPDIPKIDGRVIWASSADRGLHLLLQCWPAIKKRVPHASLHCFYHLNYSGLLDVESGHTSDQLEIAQRIRYVKNAIEELRRLDVVHHGSVSRERMNQEMSQSMVLGYPCDTIRYTEGFSVTTMEACAAGVLPVISGVDSLHHIYGSVVPMVGVPASSHLKEFEDLVVKGLTDEAWRKETVAKTKEFANRYTWKISADKLVHALQNFSR